MRNLYIALSSVALLLLASCAKDKSNYDFQPQEAVSVSGIQSNYTVISEKESLVINPEVTSTDPNADLEYLWGIYETNVQGYAPVLDTLARTKNLNYAVKQPAKGWVLVFRVTNKRTKYAQYFTSGINVVTDFTRGWYVAKDDGSQSDLDLFLTPTSIVPDGTKRENIYSFVNGSKLEGKARMMTYFTSFKSTVTGTLANTKTLVLVTDKDASVANINTLKNIRNMSTLFYEQPAVKAPDFAFYGSSAFYLINNRQVYSIYAMSANNGQFGARKLKDDQNTPYRLSPYFIGSSYGDPYFFDETSSSFLSCSMGTGTSLVGITDETGTSMPTNNNNKTMLYMGYKFNTYLPAPEYRFKVTGYAVFQDKTNTSLKILSEVATDRTKIKLVNDTLKTTDKLYNASMYTLLSEDENIIYFTVGNQVWSRNLSSKSELLQYTIPAGEEITFIRHKKYTSEAAFAHNYFMIGTKVGDSYKIRMFTKSSGSLAASPAFTLEGKGIARDVLYISPSVSEGTYPISF